MIKILIVDDSFSDAALIAGLLKKKGYVCESVSDGAQVLTRLRSIKPDLILMDVVMQQQNGFETCRRLKTDPETSSIPVVFVSAKANENDKLWGERIGAAAYLGKPFTPEQLYEVVEKGLGKRGDQGGQAIRPWGFETINTAPPPKKS